MKSRLVSILIICLCSVQQLFAHALWIETSPTGIKGRSQEVKIFFGEFADQDISPADKWFSDLKEFTLVLIAPDRSETKLVSVADKNYYKSAFTPLQNGVYTLVMHHVVKDLYGTMKLDYNSGATVIVGNQLNGNDANISSNIISLFSDSVFASKQNKAIRIKALYDGKVAAEKEIKIFAPNGWAKELYSDEKGEITVKPLWPGRYMAEFAYTDKTPGEHNGKNYEEVWKVATYIITVK